MISRGLLAAAALAVAMTWVFWAPLWTGGGLVGGDLYTYYFPQKALYADSLASGEFPLWNNRTGFGYPVLGESQTAAAYPLNPPLYGLLNVNAAYNAGQIIHYIAAFLGVVAYARVLGRTFPAAAFAALVYVYGWFPARSCWEWAIVGGAYLPWMLWCLESFVRTRRTGRLLMLALLTGLQLLAGHYNLAFITHLVLMTYALVRLRQASLGDARVRRVPRGMPAVVATVLLGYGLASVQLAPSWELKGHSQRSGGEGRFDPAYGHIPPLYLLQTVTPWLWYSADVDLDRAISGLTPLAVSAGTNRVEAHLYFGLIPVGLLLVRIAMRLWRRLAPDPILGLWSGMGLAALVYTSGWLVPLTRHLPGFAFFQGPGRCGLVATLAVALISAATLDDIAKSLRRITCLALFATLFAVTTADLWIVGRNVSYAELVERPPLLHRGEGPVASILRMSALSGQLPRMYAPGPNLPTLTGASCYPVYLGIGPIEYFTPSLMMPEEGPGTAVREARIAWLRRAAVTHVLSFERLDGDWPVDLVWSGFDPLLNPAWGRFGEPLHLYSLRKPRPRVGFALPDSSDRVEIREYRANRVVLTADSSGGGRVVLRDLDDPGWRASINNHDAPILRHEGLFRAVDVPSGNVEIAWTYRPGCVLIGAAVSAVSVVILLIAAVRTLRNRPAPTTG